MQVVRATRRVSVAMVLGVGRIGSAGECEGISSRERRRSWQRDLLLEFCGGLAGWLAGGLAVAVAGEKHVTWTTCFLTQQMTRASAGWLGRDNTSVPPIYLSAFAGLVCLTAGCYRTHPAGMQRATWAGKVNACMHAV